MRSRRVVPVALVLLLPLAWLWLRDDDVAPPAPPMAPAQVRVAPTATTGSTDPAEAGVATPVHALAPPPQRTEVEPAGIIGVALD